MKQIVNIEVSKISPVVNILMVDSNCFQQLFRRHAPGL